MYVQWQNHLTMCFSEYIPIINVWLYIFILLEVYLQDEFLELGLLSQRIKVYVILLGVFWLCHFAFPPLLIFLPTEIHVKLLNFLMGEKCYPSVANWKVILKCSLQMKNLFPNIMWREFVFLFLDIEISYVCPSVHPPT